MREDPDPDLSTRRKASRESEVPDLPPQAPEVELFVDAPSRAPPCAPHHIDDDDDDDDDES